MADDYVTYPSVTYGVTLHVSMTRMRARLEYEGPGSPFVGGDTFKLWRLKKRLRKVGEWLASRAQKRTPGFVTAPDGIRVKVVPGNPSDPLSSDPAFLIRIDGWGNVFNPAHVDLVRATRLDPGHDLVIERNSVLGTRDVEVFDATS